MFYSVTAYVEGTRCKRREVRGFDAAEGQGKKWESQGYDVQVIMECTKYIEVVKLVSPSALARDRAPRKTA